VSHSLMKRSAGVAAAIAAGLLLMAAPAQAAPTAEAAPTAAEIAANNAAVWASLPPNVTMTVIGELPKLQGPIDHYTQNGTTTTTGPTTFAAATLPFSYTFDDVWSLKGRDFTSARSTVCKDIKAYWDRPRGSHRQFKVTLQGGEVIVPADGVARSYCWSGVRTNTVRNFYYNTTNNTSGDIARVSGSGQVRYA
jgi:hypothetical protein